MKLWPHMSPLNGDVNVILYLTIFLKMYIIDSNYFSWNLLIFLWNRFCCGFDSFLPFCSSSFVESSLISSPVVFCVSACRGDHVVGIQGK